MIGTKLFEELVQSVALSHLVKGYDRISLLFLASPESGKTTIATSAECKHILRVGVLSGRSVLKEMKDHKDVEFLLFNDMGAIRALTVPAQNLLIVLLNQLVLGEKGIVAFAGKDADKIERPIGIIGCLPWEVFRDHRSKWQTLGFVSRMLPVAYSYGGELIAEIKDQVDLGKQHAAARPRSKLKPPRGKQIEVRVPNVIIRKIRNLSDERAKKLGEKGIRLLQSYHSLIRAHALLGKRRDVTQGDLLFLRGVDHFVSVTECKELELLSGGF